jgi:hypothetical protein
VLICRHCKTVVGPEWQRIEQHLRRAPHRALGLTLTASRAYARSLTLQTLDGLRQGKPQLPCTPLAFLATFEGYSCLLCEQQQQQEGGRGSTTSQARFFTTHLPRLQRNHLPSHGRTAKEHGLSPLWRSCQLQTYFTAKGRIDYFEVASPTQQASQAQLKAPPPLALAKQALFASLEHSASTIQQDIIEQASIVRDLNSSRTERVPWLEKTGFPAYLAGLQDSQIKSAYKLPPKLNLEIGVRVRPIMPCRFTKFHD